jgi:hypothetical protein
MSTSRIPAPGLLISDPIEGRRIHFRPSWYLIQLAHLNLSATHPDRTRRSPGLRALAPKTKRRSQVALPTSLHNVIRIISDATWSKKGRRKHERAWCQCPPERNLASKRRIVGYHPQSSCVGGFAQAPSPLCAVKHHAILVIPNFGEEGVLDMGLTESPMKSNEITDVNHERG